MQSPVDPFDIRICHIDESGGLASAGSPPTDFDHTDLEWIEAVLDVEGVYYCCLDSRSRYTGKERLRQ